MQRRYGLKHMLKRFKRSKDSDALTASPSSNKSAATDKPNVPKQERPRICLFDVDLKLAEILDARGFNCYRGTLGSIVDIPNTSARPSHQCLLAYDFPLNLHEYDIVIIDLQNPTRKPYNSEEHMYKECKGREQPYIVSSFPETLFDPRPLSASILRNKLQTLLDKDSILIVFTDQQEVISYQPVVVTIDGPRSRTLEHHTLYDFYSFLPISENISGRDTNVVSSIRNEITSLLKKHNDDATYYIAFRHPIYQKGQKYFRDENFMPLMEAGAERIVAFSRRYRKNVTFFFPTIKDKQGFLCELLDRVLPGTMPSVFPYSTEFAWLADPRYRLPNEQELILQREQLEVEYLKKIDKVDETIDANRKEFGFLHDLLTQSGDALVKTVERFLSWMGFGKVINVDETDPDMQEEDLRVETDGGLLVIEVKGIGGTSTDAECSQISKIKYRRSKERNSFDVFALYCVNHQRFLPPANRQNPPFNLTQINDAKNEDRGLVTTYELFKLYFNILHGFVSKEDARKALFHTGLVRFCPSDAQELPGPPEIHHKGLVLVFRADGIQLRVGLEVIIDSGGFYSAALIEEIQVDGTTVESAISGEVGVRLSAPVSRGNRVWFRSTPK